MHYIHSCAVQLSSEVSIKMAHWVVYSVDLPRLPFGRTTYYYVADVDIVLVVAAVWRLAFGAWVKTSNCQFQQLSTLRLSPLLFRFIWLRFAVRCNAMLNAQFSLLTFPDFPRISFLTLFAVTHLSKLTTKRWPESDVLHVLLFCLSSCRFPVASARFPAECHERCMLKWVTSGWVGRLGGWAVGRFVGSWLWLWLYLWAWLAGLFATYPRDQSKPTEWQLGA